MNVRAVEFRLKMDYKRNVSNIIETPENQYDIRIYGAQTRLSERYKYSLKFSEFGRVLKQSIILSKFT